jgi:hypothetical protein
MSRRRLAEIPDSAATLARIGLTDVSTSAAHSASASDDNAVWARVRRAYGPPTGCTELDQLNKAPTPGPSPMHTVARALGSADGATPRPEHAIPPLNRKYQVTPGVKPPKSSRMLFKLGAA